jgi:hypothetical protein
VKVYKTQQEVERDIKDGVLAIEGDVRFECSISIEASIIVESGNINAENINAWDINAGNITAGNINAGNITAGDITAGNINARDINAGDINAGNITARNINAWDILYYAFCCVYKSIKCFSIKAKRDIHKEPICLEGKIEYKTKEPNLSGKEVSVTLEGKTYKAIIQ